MVGKWRQGSTLTQWARDKKAIVSQRTFANLFSGFKIDCIVIQVLMTIVSRDSNNTKHIWLQWTWVWGYMSAIHFPRTCECFLVLNSHLLVDILRSLIAIIMSSCLKASNMCILTSVGFFSRITLYVIYVGVCYQLVDLSFINCDVIKLNIFRVTGHLCGEFTAPRHKGQWRGALMFFFDLRLN